MGYRERKISASIVKAVFLTVDGKTGFLGRLLAFFRIFDLALTRFEPDQFRKLRQEIWKIEDSEYNEAFSKDNGRDPTVHAVGDLGYSGSVSLGPS
jgi:hypothetical protein